MKKKIILFSSIGGALLIAAIVLIIVLCLPKDKSYRSIKVFNVNVIRNNSSRQANETKMCSRLTFMSSKMNSAVTVITSTGVENSFMHQDADSDYYDSSINYVIVRASYLNRVDYSLYNIICDTEFTVDVDLDETSFNTLVEKAKEKYDLDILGYGSGIFNHKVYFVTGED